MVCMGPAMKLVCVCGGVVVVGCPCVDSCGGGDGR